MTKAGIHATNLVPKNKMHKPPIKDREFEMKKAHLILMNLTSIPPKIEANISVTPDT